MQSFILLLLKFFTADRCHSAVALRLYTSSSLMFTHTEVMCPSRSRLWEIEKKTLVYTCVCVCVCVHVGFTLARSRVQQKVVMGRWVQGQTRGPVEVKTRCVRGQRNESEGVCVSVWGGSGSTDVFKSVFSEMIKINRHNCVNKQFGLRQPHIWCCEGVFVLRACFDPVYTTQWGYYVFFRVSQTQFSVFFCMYWFREEGSSNLFM